MKWHSKKEGLEYEVCWWNQMRKQENPEKIGKNSDSIHNILYTILSTTAIELSS